MNEGPKRCVSFLEINFRAVEGHLCELFDTLFVKFLVFRKLRAKLAFLPLK